MTSSLHSCHRYDAVRRAATSPSSRSRGFSSSIDRILFKNNLRSHRPSLKACASPAYLKVIPRTSSGSRSPPLRREVNITRSDIVGTSLVDDQCLFIGFALDLTCHSLDDIASRASNERLVQTPHLDGVALDIGRPHEATTERPADPRCERGCVVP